MALVELRNVTKTSPATSRRGDPVVAIDGVDLDVEAGDIFGIVGYPGAGKFTLVRLVNALESVTSGTVTVDGVDITALKERQLQKMRLGIGMVFQQFNLFNSRTVYGNIAYPCNSCTATPALRDAAVRRILIDVGVDRDLRSLTVELVVRYGVPIADAASAAHAVIESTLDELMGSERSPGPEVGQARVVDVTIGDPRVVDPADEG